MFDDWPTFSLDFGKQEKAEPQEAEQGVHVSHRMGHRQLTRKASSEKALESALDWHFHEGDCYHCFSFGDVDFLSYVKHVLRQQRAEYIALSTWCMAGEDVLDLRQWHRGVLLAALIFSSVKSFRAVTPRRGRRQAIFAASAAGGLLYSETMPKLP